MNPLNDKFVSSLEEIRKDIDSWEMQPAFLKTGQSRAIFYSKVLDKINAIKETLSKTPEDGVKAFIGELEKLKTKVIDYRDLDTHTGLSLIAKQVDALFPQTVSPGDKNTERLLFERNFRTALEQRDEKSLAHLVESPFFKEQTPHRGKNLLPADCLHSLERMKEVYVFIEKTFSKRKELIPIFDRKFLDILEEMPKEHFTKEDYTELLNFPAFASIRKTGIVFEIIFVQKLLQSKGPQCIQAVMENRIYTRYDSKMRAQLFLTALMRNAIPPEEIKRFYHEMMGKKDISVQEILNFARNPHAFLEDEAKEKESKLAGLQRDVELGFKSTFNQNEQINRIMELFEVLDQMRPHIDEQQLKQCIVGLSSIGVEIETDVETLVAPLLAGRELRAFCEAMTKPFTPEESATHLKFLNPLFFKELLSRNPDQLFKEPFCYSLEDRQVKQLLQTIKGKFPFQLDWFVIFPKAGIETFEYIAKRLEPTNTKDKQLFVIAASIATKAENPNCSFEELETLVTWAVTRYPPVEITKKKEEEFGKALKMIDDALSKFSDSQPPGEVSRARSRLNALSKSKDTFKRH